MSDSPNESDDLRREMEGHLSMLEDEARRAGASPHDAAREAEKRFGNAVGHFRQSLAEWTRRQQSLRNTLIGIAFAALLISAAGILINVRLLDQLRNTVEAIASSARRNDEVGPRLGYARYPGILIEVSWMSTYGVVRKDLPTSKTGWEKATSGIARDCPDGELPVFNFTLLSLDNADFYDVSVGTTVTCKPKMYIPLDGGGPPIGYDMWLAHIPPSLQTIRCVPCK